MPSIGTKQAVALVLGLAFIVSACSSSHKSAQSPASTTPTTLGATGQTAQVPTNGGTLNFGEESDTQSMDPAEMTAFDAYGAQMFFDVYGALLIANTQASPPVIQPLIAQSFTTSDNGKTWVLVLRPNLVFSDGTPLNAAAVKYNWQRIANPATASPMAINMAGVTSMTVTNPTTLTISLSTPNTLFNDTVADSALSYIGSPTAIQKEGKNFGTQPVGAGPFLLKSWTQGVHAVLTASPTYFAAKSVHLSTINITPIGDNTQEENAYETGAENVLFCSQNTVYSTIQKNGGSVATIPLLGPITFDWNVTKPPFNSNAMRVAITEALNRNAIAQAWNLGQPAPQSAGLLVPGSPYFDPSPAADYPAYNPSAAAAAISSYENAHGPVHLTLLFTTGNPAPLDAAETAQSELQSIKGVTVTLDSVDLSAYVSYLFTGKWNISFNGLSYANIIEPTFYNTFHTKGELNAAGLSDPVIDHAIDNAQSTTNTATQQQDWDIVQQEVAKDAFYPPVATNINHICYSPKVHLSYFADGFLRTDEMWVGN